MNFIKNFIWLLSGEISFWYFDLGLLHVAFVSEEGYFIHLIFFFCSHHFASRHASFFFVIKEWFSFGMLEEEKQNYVDIYFIKTRNKIIDLRF